MPLPVPVNLQIRISEATRDALRAMAERDGRSTGSLARILIEQGIIRHRATAAVLGDAADLDPATYRAYREVLAAADPPRRRRSRRADAAAVKGRRA